MQAGFGCMIPVNMELSCRVAEWLDFWGAAMWVRGRICRSRDDMLTCSFGNRFWSSAVLLGSEQGWWGACFIMWCVSSKRVRSFAMCAQCPLLQSWRQDPASLRLGTILVCTKE
eukprot:scaffold189522_cov18-Tisochrysis_lutea.AAC.1